MEALDDLEPNTGIHVLNLGILGGGPGDDHLRRQMVNLVRLVDVAIYEYEVARRRARVEYEERGGWGYSIAAMSHLELSVITARRALRASSYVYQHRETPPIDRPLRRLITRVDAAIGDVRNMIVHIDEEIQGGNLAQGENHVLRISHDGARASIGQETLNLPDYATTLRRLHEVASAVARC